MIRVFFAFRTRLRPHLKTLAAGLGLAVAEVGLNLAQPWPLRFVVDEVLTSGGTRLPAQLLVGLAVVALMSIVGLAAVADYWSTWFLAGVGQRIGDWIRRDVYSNLQALSLGFHGSHQVGDLTARVTSDTDRVQDLLVQSLAVLVPNALLLGGMVAVMAAIDPGFTLLALTGTPVLAVVVVSSTRRLKVASRRARTHSGMVASATAEALAAIGVVQALGLERQFGSRFGDLSDASLGASLEAVREEARFSPYVDAAGAVSLALVLGMGAGRVLAGTMTLGVLLVFLSYVGSLYKPLKALAKLGTLIGKGVASAERVQVVLNERPVVADQPGARPLGDVFGNIVFDSVSFSYEREPVLRQFNLTVAAGETVAFVGSTGAGKSTLLSLIPRLYDVTEGSIRIDGTDVREVTLESLRSQVAIVLQDTVLFRGTIADNIALGLSGASRRRVERAARMALVDEFATRFPDGLDTRIGERGVGLSGGQRQRIAIARAILRDSPILLLDEPTSALDVESEALVMEALARLMKGRTTLVVAHRLSTIRSADRVVVVEGGRIVEVGPARILAQTEGRFSELLEMASGT